MKRVTRVSILMLAFRSSLALLAAMSAGCRDGGMSPSTPSTVATSSTSGAATAVFTIEMPTRSGDAGNVAYGIWPFGVHGSSHAFDGHPGWDVEYQNGASVLAAADGVVQSVMTDTNAPEKFTVQISHRVNNSDYRTVYTNIVPVATGILPGAAVSAGQPIGTAGSVTIRIGAGSVTFSMTHFQLDDFSRSSGLSNLNATSPGSYLSPSGSAIFEAMWESAAYNQELIEPFPANPRDASFPLTRMWTRLSGSLSARIDFRRADPTRNDYEYVLFGQNNEPVETGTATVQPRPGGSSTIDLRTSAGGTRLGVYDVVGETMRLDLGEPGASRPADLANASIYQTR